MDQIRIEITIAQGVRVSNRYFRRVRPWGRHWRGGLQHWSRDVGEKGGVLGCNAIMLRSPRRLFGKLSQEVIGATTQPIIVIDPNSLFEFRDMRWSAIWIRHHSVEH